MNLNGNLFFFYLCDLIFSESVYCVLLTSGKVPNYLFLTTEQSGDSDTKSILGNGKKYVLTGSI